jgi:HD-GYP domain-containing protein (c-di-GMP phosphodiesterase class II)
MGEVPAVLRNLDDRQALEISLAENARREPLLPEERRAALKRLAELFPGRPAQELEGWLGPATASVETESIALAGASTAEVPGGTSVTGLTIALPDWMDAGEEEDFEEAAFDTAASGPDTDARTQGAPRHSLVGRTRSLLKKLKKRGELDTGAMKKIIREIFDTFESQPLADFLDLTYHEEAKRCVPRHSVHVAKLGMYLARELGLARPDMERVAVCGLLHDAGMMSLQDAAFTKNPALDDEEWSASRGHPTDGSILQEKEVLLRDVVGRVLREQPGKSEPAPDPGLEGKRREEIHLFAKVLNVVDTYEALISPRAHRLPVLPFKAMQVVIDNGARGMLDWDLVNAFVRSMSVYPVGSYLRLAGGEIARVVRANAAIPEKPVIAIVADAQRSMLSAPVQIDLAMAEPPEFEPIAPPLM